MVVSIANSKGGSTKSTTCFNLSIALGKQGKKVLVVDTDVQCSLSNTFLSSPSSNTLIDAYNGMDLTPVKTYCDNVDLIPSTKNLSSVSMRMNTDFELLYHLKDKLQKFTEYDYILIDTPPTVEGMTVSAFIASRYILIPVAVQFYTLQALNDLLNAFQKVKNRLNPELDILGVIPSMVDMRTVLCRELVDEIKSSFNGKTTTMIPRTVRVEESQVAKKGVIDLFPESDVAVQFNKLAKEIIEKTK